MLLDFKVEVFSENPLMFEYQYVTNCS
jgi:hypothetical protein